MPDADLLGQPHIEEAVGVLVAELHERRADVGRDDPEVRVLLAEFGEGRSDDRTGTEELTEGEGDRHQTLSFVRDASSAAIARSRSAAPSEPACQARLCSMKSTPLPLTVSQMTTVGRSLSVVRQRVDRLDQLAHVVPVDVHDVPAERGPLVGVGLEDHALFGEARHELAVAVDERDQIAELVAAGRHRGLPHRSLTGLAVTEQAHHAVRLPAAAGAQRHAHRDRQTVPEGAGRALHAGQLHLARVHAVRAVELTVGVDDPLVGEEPADRHRDVHAHRGVALAQHEAVALGIAQVGRIDVQTVLEQRREDVRCGQIAADVHGALVRSAQVQQLRAELERQVFQLFHGVRTLAGLKGRLTHHMPPHRCVD